MTRSIIIVSLVFVALFFSIANVNTDEGHSSESNYDTNLGNFYNIKAMVCSAKENAERIKKKVLEAGIIEGKKEFKLINNERFSGVACVFWEGPIFLVDVQKGFLRETPEEVNQNLAPVSIVRVGVVLSLETIILMRFYEAGLRTTITRSDHSFQLGYAIKTKGNSPWIKRPLFYEFEDKEK